MQDIGGYDFTGVSGITTKAVDAKTNHVKKQTVQEVEVAYKATDSLTLNPVYFTAKVDEGANKNDKYKWTGFGVKYTIAPGLYTSLGYKNFDYTNAKEKTKSNSGNTIRVRVHAGF